MALGRRLRGRQPGLRAEPGLRHACATTAAGRSPAAAAVKPGQPLAAEFAGRDRSAARSKPLLGAAPKNRRRRLASTPAMPRRFTSSHPSGAKSISPGRFEDHQRLRDWPELGPPRAAAQKSTQGIWRRSARRADRRKPGPAGRGAGRARRGDRIARQQCPGPRSSRPRLSCTPRTHSASGRRPPPGHFLTNDPPAAPRLEVYLQPVGAVPANRSRESAPPAPGRPGCENTAWRREIEWRGPDVNPRAAPAAESRARGLRLCVPWGPCDCCVPDSHQWANFCILFV